MSGHRPGGRVPEKAPLADPHPAPPLSPSYPASAPRCPPPPASRGPAPPRVLKRRGGEAGPPPPAARGLAGEGSRPKGVLGARRGRACPASLACSDPPGGKADRRRPRIVNGWKRI